MSASIPPDRASPPPDEEDAPPRGVRTLPEEEAALPRASGAVVVPTSAIALHVTLVWAAPHAPALLDRWLPWPVEGLLVWLPWFSVISWAGMSPRAAAGRSMTRGDRVRDALIALGALLCSAHYVIRFRWRGAQEEWTAERCVSELAAFFSTTWHGAPWAALAYLFGWIACAAVLARAIGDVSDPRNFGSPLLHRGVQVVVLGIFLIGSSAVLRYATGSPWPFLAVR